MSQAPQNPQASESAEAQADRSVDIPASPFQRPGQPAAAAPNAPRAAAPAYSAYPSAYGVSPASSAATDPKGRRLIIGQGITMSGEIESCDLLVVEGTVEAALKGASVLEIAETGMFYGTVEINEATIAGKFEGDLTVNGRLTVRASGSITGAISYKELAVEAGATIDGKLSPVGGKGASSEKKSHRGQSVDSPAKKAVEQISPEEDDLPILQRAAGR
ncbi:MAG TPA: polymer-forming cytoskeletal protein [Alphaproteobacteria bacterium]|nr:polymer-forming cytoskeletal protein [Alphaproteobacteria bacterium]HNS44454.1 polymer-forming cytoskeletal protein [Alphaproteobacteria bacterium]